MAPKKGSNLRRKHSIYVYCDEKEKQVIIDAAEKDRRSLSQFCLLAIFDYIDRTQGKSQPRKNYPK